MTAKEGITTSAVELLQEFSCSGVQEFNSFRNSAVEPVYNRNYEVPTEGLKTNQIHLVVFFSAT